MLTIYSLYIHCMFIICSLYTHYMFKVRVLAEMYVIFEMLIVYSLYIHCMFTIYSLYIHCTFTICSLYYTWHKCTQFAKCSNLEAKNVVHFKLCQQRDKLKCVQCNVSVNSNWVHPPPRQPRGNFFWASESRSPGQIFLSNSLPRGKKWWSNSRGWGKIFPDSKKLLLKLAKKILKKLRKLWDSTTFYLENLKKPLCFRLKQNN